MNEEDDHPYIAFLKVAQPTAPDRLEYAFHTFSLRNERCYPTTGDVTFASPNPDTNILDDGVALMVRAVLQVDATAKVVHAQELRAILDATDDDEIEFGKGFLRSRADLETLYAQSLVDHNHDH